MNEQILYRSLKVIEEYYDNSSYGDADIFRIKDIIHSLDKNHWESKQWLAETFRQFYRKETGTFYVLGGWYGMTAYQLRQLFPSQEMYIISSDMDPQCKRIGSRLLKDHRIEFRTFDMFGETYNNVNALISTSAEHVDRDQLVGLIDNKPNHTWVVLQSNNYFDHPTHINCSKSLEDFEAYLEPHMQIYWSGSLPNDGFDRFMVIGK